MGSVTALFDSNILVDSLLGNANADQELGRYPARAICIMTWMEVMAGAKPHEANAIRQFLRTFERLAITDEIAERTVDLRRLTRLKLPDAIILATAEITGFRLITRNTKDFSSSNPIVHIPYRI